MEVKIILAFVVSLAIALIIGWPIIIASKKFKLSQTILHYVEAHEGKQGTPTMGGFIFIFSIIISTLVFVSKDYSLALISLAIMLAYAIVGFLDDFIKIKFKQNQGLRAYQKVIGQVGIALIIAIFAYKSAFVGGEIRLPFSSVTLNLGFWIIPFIVVVMLAITNSVNLLDGLDGLASGVSFVCLLAFGVITLLISKLYIVDVQTARETSNIILLCFASAGGLLGFLCYNGFPAKIFMGDTGSLALGGLIGAIAIFTKLELLLVIIGIMFVVSSLSDIIQVLHYKRTKRRIFLMAPLHHHFEKKGVHENRIVLIYIVITTIISLLCVMGYCLL